MFPDQPLMATLRRRQLMKGSCTSAIAKGMLRALMPYGRPAADVAHDLRLLLRH